MQARALVFDLYGTLFDVHSVARACDAAAPGRGREISALWRQKQLEYTWLRSLMDRYVSFERATEDALEYVDEALSLGLDASTRAALCDGYLALSPFPEVPAALERLRDAGFVLAILSNGSHRSIASVVGHAGLADRFDALLSVEDVGVFKPDPRVYALVEARLGVARASTVFASSNAWDVTGAGHFGFATCWVRRQPTAAFERMDQRPMRVVGGIDELARAVVGEAP